MLHKLEIKKGGQGPFYLFTRIFMVVMTTKCLNLGKYLNIFSETTVPISPKIRRKVLWMFAFVFDFVESLGLSGLKKVWLP